jgi:hypothetical protein
MQNTLAECMPPNRARRGVWRQSPPQPGRWGAGVGSEGSPVVQVDRVVLLGASNLTRGIRTVVAAARAAWGKDIQVLAALGHGRSYGARSTVLLRTLPGILDAGLWQRLAALPPAPTRALVTDVGNDILYGFDVEQILAWVGEAVDRLQGLTSDITLTELPLASIDRLSPGKFRFFRTMLFPSCHLSFREVRRTAARVNQGLAALAAARQLRLFRPEPAWYGLDPIHIRPSFWRPAWQGMLGLGLQANGGCSTLPEMLRLFFISPERRWLCGREQITPQSGAVLPCGGRVWFY